LLQHKIINTYFFMLYMLCKLVIIEDMDSVEDDWNLYFDYSYLEYYLCDTSSKRVIILKNRYAKGIVGKNEDRFELKDDFDYETFIERVKEASDKNEEECRDFETLSLPGNKHRGYKPPIFRLRKLEDIEVDKDFFESVFQHYKNHQTEKRRFEAKITNLFEKYEMSP